MANIMKQYLIERTVVIKKSVLRPEFAPQERRLFKVIGGFGADPFTVGTALFGRWTWVGGSEIRMEGYDIDMKATLKLWKDNPEVA